MELLPWLMNYLSRTIKRVRKYRGKLIYQGHDDEGILEIIDAGGVRSLYFGSESKQSCMLLDDPDYLYIPYVRTMMSWRLFQDKLEHALLIGLGGGSLAKHLLQTFPEAQVRVVEYRKSVLKIARSHFGLPLDPRLKCIIGDGGHYVKQAVSEQAQRYDVLLVDAFDHEAMSTSVDNMAFFDACRMLLTDSGVLVMNLWGTHNATFVQTVDYLERSFAAQVLYLPVDGRGNIIVLAFAQPRQYGTYREIQTKSAYLAQQSRIEYPIFLKNLKKNNSEKIGQFMKLKV